MRPRPPLSNSYARSVFSALAITFAISSATFAQLSTFDPSFDGELWGVRRTLTIADDGDPAGVAFSGGLLYVADGAHRTVVVYTNAGAVVPFTSADWNASDPLSPVFGLVPNQLAPAVVNVDGVDRNALLISDAKSNRVAAFDAADGNFLFTLRLQRPTADPTYSLSTGQIAMSPLAKFTFTTAAPALTLTGSFAAGWREQLLTGRVNSGAFAFAGASSIFPSSGGEFLAAPTAILDGTEGNPVAPPAAMVVGVSFDSAGNLYTLDALNERLHVYSPSFARLFTFGTPVAGGGTAEFYEPWGLTFWPDAAGAGGRILINDTYNSRIMIYRPADGPDADTVVDHLQFESSIANFVAPNPPIELFAIAVDAATGTLAVSDFAEVYDNAIPRVVILEKPRLAAFDLQLLDEDGAVVSSVCADTGYKLRFSLTVPAGLASVTDVAPALTIDGMLAGIAPVPGAVYPTTLPPGGVMTFTYTLPGIAADVEVIASATASNTTDVSSRNTTVFVADCAGESGPTQFTLEPSAPPQVSGWTPVRDNDDYSIALDVTDEDGTAVIEYELLGASATPGVIASPFEDLPVDTRLIVPIPYAGRTTLRYRGRDGNGIWSPWLTFDVRTKTVVDLTTNENSPVEFRVGDPEGVGFTYSVSSLPAGVTFSTTTGQFAGVVSFDAVLPYSPDTVLSSGVHHVVVTETAPSGATSSVGFTWTINHINRPPIITTQVPPGFSIQLGQPFSLQINGFDPDNDPVVFTVHGRSPAGRDLPPSITIDRDTGLISGFFPLDADSRYDFRVGLAECSAVTNPPCVQPLPGERLATLLAFTVGVIEANLPPDIVNPGPQSSAEGQAVSLQIAASDAEGDALTYSAGGLPPGLSIDPVSGLISGTVSFAAAGVHAVTVEVDDHVNAPRRSVTFSWTVTRNNAAPVCTAAAGGEIWPPNHKKFYAAPITGVIDPDGNPITITVTGIWQDEPIDATGDGQFAPDGRIENGQAWIRAERNGHGNNARGNGRVYEIFFTAADDSGGTCSGSVLWTVPHDRGQRAAAIDDGVRYDSTGSVAGARDKSQLHAKGAKR